MNPLFGIIERDLTVYLRNRSEWMMPMTYFLVIVSLFPITIEPSENLLLKLAPGIIWISVVLALLLSIEQVFRLDYQSGALEQFILSVHALPLLLLGKSIAHCLAMGLPLLFLALFTGFLFQMPPNGICVLMITLLIGIPLLSLISTLGVALTIGLQRSGLLLAILVLPLVIPIIIFATQAITKACQLQTFYAELFLLAALFALALGTLPFVIAGAFKMAIE